LRSLWWAEQPHKVLLLSVAPPGELSVPMMELEMPPPIRPAELPERVQLLTVSGPELMMPPPVTADLLPERVMSVSVRVPLFWMPPPPFSSSRPLLSVRPERVTMPETLKMR
jgi:hypothetical protein